MAASILESTKLKLGLADAYTVFDDQIIDFINTSFARLQQLGVGPVEGFFITDKSQEWSAIGLSPLLLNQVKTYIYLKARMTFDPPTTSFHIEAMNRQIAELEWLMNVDREQVLHPLEENPA